MTGGTYDLTPGRLCGGCGAELSRFRKSFCSMACRMATPRAFVCNPNGRPRQLSAVTPEFRTKLCGLWADGVVTAEIGLQLGVTKNSVIGFAHRWGLVPRESPIIRNGPTKPRQPHKERAPRRRSEPGDLRAPHRQSEPHVARAPKRKSEPNSTRAPTEGSEPSSRRAPTDGSEPWHWRAPRCGSEPRLGRAPQSLSEPSPPPIIFKSCQYPQGDRGDWRWCGAPVARGCPYCATHLRVCYAVPPRSYRLDVAA